MMTVIFNVGPYNDSQIFSIIDERSCAANSLVLGGGGGRTSVGGGVLPWLNILRVINERKF